MKKYNKPELNIEVINLETSIAISGTVGGTNHYGANGTDNVTFDQWKDLFGN